MMGALLVEKKIITSEQLEQALVLQQESGELIGEILVDAFGVSRVEIAGVLAEQWTDLDKAERAETAARAERMPPAPVEPLAPMEPRLRRPLGQILVEYGFVTRAAGRSGNCRTVLVPGSTRRDSHRTGRHHPDGPG